jgi:nucleoside-diphosphate-sugar epimerase
MLTHQIAAPGSVTRTVILGSRGFVGGRLAAHLAEAGVPVLGLSSRDIDLTAPTAIEALAGRLNADDSLVFVSALTPDKGRDIATMMRNLRMGEHVCAAVARTPCAHVVYVSSDAVYADDANPVRETSCASPSSFHGTMHLVRERMLIETARAAKVPLAILRPSLLYGPGDTHNGYGPNRFVRTALADRKIALFGGGEEKRDHVFIDDVSRIIELVLRRRSTGVLNIATGTAVSFHDVADVIASTVAGVAIEPSARANPITHRHFDTTAIASAFPAFRFTPIAGGLETTLSVDQSGAARAVD